MSNRILYFHTSNRYEYFRDFLGSMHKSHNWEIGIVCPSLEAETYSDIIKDGGVIFPLPDISKEMDWEKDENDKSALFKLIGECEYASNISSGRITLSDERHTGRAYSQNSYYFPSSELVRDSLCDNEKPTIILARIFSFVKNTLDNFRPDLLIVGGSNSPLHFTASIMAKKYLIPYLISRRSKVLSQRLYWTDDSEMFNSLVKEKYNIKVKNGEAASRFSRKFIEGFREGPKTVQYILDNWKKGDSANWFNIHRNFLALLNVKIRYILNGNKGRKPKSVITRIWGYYRSKFLQMRQRYFYSRFDRKNLANMRYIYYPLHKEPELALNFQAPLWHDQKHTISYISAMLPAGYRLLVKEHRFNWGRRPTGYLKSMTRFPNVLLIDPFDNQFKYIKNADLIITDNGSTGWEGLILRRPVITLERTFYDIPGLANRVTEPSKLDQSIIQTLKNPFNCPWDEYDRRLGLFIDAEMETTISEDEPDHKLGLGMIDQLLERVENRKAANIAK